VQYRGVAGAASVRLVVGLGGHEPDQLIEVVIRGAQDDPGVIGSHGEHHTLAVETEQLQTTANDVLNALQGQQHRLTSRVEEVQQTLDLHGGRLDRIEDNQRRQSEQLAGLSDQLAEVLTVLRGLGPSD
jgi:hypothetical protein